MKYCRVVEKAFNKFVLNNTFKIEQDSVFAQRLKNLLQSVYDSGHAQGYTDYYYDNIAPKEDNFNHD